MNKSYKEVYSMLPEGLQEFVYKIFRRNEIKSLKKCISLIENDINDEEYEKNLLLGILKYSYNNSKYYHNMFENKQIDINNLKIEDIQKLDLLDKEKIKDNFDTIKVEKFKSLKKQEMRTGGTTGVPLHFYRSIEQGVIDKVCMRKLYKKMGYKKGDLILTFNGSKVSEDKVKKGIYYSRKGSNIPYGSIYISSLYLTRNNTMEFIRQIEDIKPDILRGYPSFIYDISKYILDNNIKLSLKIKGIKLTSEVVTENQIDVIERAWNTKIHFQYGHSEACIYAEANRDGKYYCNPYYGYVEVLDSNGKQVQEGEVGEVVVTSYHNKVMPFIRYRTNDYAEYGGKENGYVVLNKLYGRAQDSLFDMNGNKLSIMTALLTHRLDAFDNISSWKIEQKEQGNIVMSIIKGKKYSKYDEEEIRNHFKNICNINTIFSYVTDIKREANGKFRLIDQHLR